MNCVKPFVTPMRIVDGVRTGGLEVPCGHCTHCRIQRTAEWSMRLLHEYSNSDHASFITLTYDDEHIPQMDYYLNDQLIQIPTLQKSEVQTFMKRLRKRTKGTKLKYFACGEYGDQTYRPHYHLILFNYSPLIFPNFHLNDVWDKGFTHVGSVTKESCQYVAGYVQKKWYGDETQSPYYPSLNPFSLKSQGLGKQFVLNNKDQLLLNAGTSINGVPVGLPRYYKKILTNDDPQQLAELNKRIVSKKTPVDIAKLLSRATTEEQYQLLHPKHPLDHKLWTYIQTELKKGREQYNKTLISREKLFTRDSL